MKKVPFEDLKFDPVYQGIYLTAEHNGEAFTGIAYLNDEEFDEYSEYSYKDGKAEGIWNTKLKSKNLIIEEQQFNNGLEVGIHREWYPNGKLKSEKTYKNGELLESKIWPEGGTVKPNK